jgi:hypothetical protein
MPRESYRGKLIKGLQKLRTGDGNPQAFSPDDKAPARELLAHDYFAAAMKSIYTPKLSSLPSEPTISMTDSWGYDHQRGYMTFDETLPDLSSQLLLDPSFNSLAFDSDNIDWSDVQKDFNSFSPWTMDPTMSLSSPESYDLPFSFGGISDYSTTDSSPSSCYTSAPHSPHPTPPPSTRPSSPEPSKPTPSKSSPEKTCSHCKTTSTPLWRRDPRTREPMCNACGLYLQQRNKLRPQVLIDADADVEGEEDDSIYDPSLPSCSHCQTRKTSVWRRGKDGAQLCNACGVYQRLRGKVRILSFLFFDSS